MKRSYKILAVIILAIVSTYFTLNHNYKNEIITQNIEAITTVETTLEEYQVLHFPCVNDYGQNNGTYVGKCFKGGQHPYHQHNCSTCNSVIK